MYHHHMQTTSGNISLRFKISGLLASILLLAACTTAPVESTSDQKANTVEIQQQRFLLGKEFYLNKDYVKAAKVLLPLAQQGHLDAQYTVGYMYHYGYGFARNERESTRWIAAAAARGHAKAKEALQMINAAHDQQNQPPSP